PTRVTHDAAFGQEAGAQFLRALRTTTADDPEHIEPSASSSRAGRRHRRTVRNQRRLYNINQRRLEGTDEDVSTRPGAEVPTHEGGKTSSVLRTTSTGATTTDATTTSTSTRQSRNYTGTTALPRTTTGNYSRTDLSLSLSTPP
ncbi:unnamed protein product, partial [Amoebophrya sp. A120]